MRLSYALLSDRDEAEDVMQETLTFALTHLDRYDESRAAFGTWLHTIAVNRCRDRGRRISTRLRRVAAWAREESPRGTVDPEDRLTQIDASSAVGQALQSLTPKQREAVALREIDGLSFKEMGETLGVPMRTAQARLHSAYTALRRAVTEAEAARGDHE